jgi:hypothetical protein
VAATERPVASKQSEDGSKVDGRYSKMQKHASPWIFVKDFVDAD